MNLVQKCSSKLSLQNDTKIGHGFGMELFLIAWAIKWYNILYHNLNKNMTPCSSHPLFCFFHTLFKKEGDNYKRVVVVGRGWDFSGSKILFTKQTPTRDQCSCALSLIDDDDDDAVFALDVPRKLQGQYGLRPRWGLLNSVASKIEFFKTIFETNLPE